MRLLVALALVVSAAACGDGAASPSDAAIWEPAPGQAVTFRLRYEPSDPAAVPIYGAVKGCQTEWIRIRDLGQRDIPFELSCTSCLCAACANSDPCPTCDCDPRPAHELTAGEYLDYDWNGTVYARGSGPCAGGCAIPRPLDPGRYLARFCVTAELRAEDHTCVGVPFDYPVPSGVVEHVVRGLP